MNDPRLRALGERIRTLRRARKMSQEQFAEAGQFHRTFAGAIERGETNISFSTLARIADALNVKMADLFAGLEDGKLASVADSVRGRSAEVDRSRLRREITALERALSALKHIAEDPHPKDQRTSISARVKRK